MSATPEPVGSLQTALEHTQRLLTSEPRLAAEQATEILKVAPGHPLASLLLGVAHRRGLRSAHQVFDARPAPAGSGGGVMRKPHSGRRVVAACTSEAASDGRACDAHARGSRGASASLP